ncbi:MAG: metal ABC transporter substrate-binding protein [Bowdeniella nasicola]|nr:metal ABC transporter substrate-binding protein [Bowdeniella nasicola]
MRKLIPILGAAALALTGCTTSHSASEGSADSADAERLHVLASFYPLRYLAEQVGGDLVTVTSLTPAGAEPHDLELSPAQVADIGKADAVVYLSGFQPSVDSAIQESAPPHVYDAADDADLRAAADQDHADHDHDHGEPDHDHGDHDPHHHDHGGIDPHFWLDPERMAHVAEHLAETLGDAAPEHAETFSTNAHRLAGELESLKGEFDKGLATCTHDTVIVAHEAYGYLLADYGLTQVGLSGLDPEAEPSPATLAHVKSLMADRGVTTIFTESLINPKAAEVFAAETGADTAVLDPLESQVDAGKDYRDVMRENLAALRTALECQ